MKFLCDRCKTRYSIGDDRVRGKILKIRCKNCNNVITVREGMPDADAVADTSGSQARKKQTTAAPAIVGASAAPNGGSGALGLAFANAMTKPPPALEEEWYVSIDGDQAGPFSLAEAQRWVATKAFDAELHCWSEGFDDWLPVDKVSHFRGLRKKAPPAPTPPPLPRIAPGAARAMARNEIEEEPKPLFAATMASLEKSASMPIGAASGAPASARAPLGGMPSATPSKGQPSLQARPNGSPAVGARAIPSLSPARPGAAKVDARVTTKPGYGAKPIFDVDDGGSESTQIEPPPFGDEQMTAAEPAAAAARRSAFAGDAAATTPAMKGVTVPDPRDIDGDGELDIGEVSRVVKLADIARANPRAGVAATPAARRSGPMAGIARASVPKLGTGPHANMAGMAAGDPAFGDPNANADLSMVAAPAVSHHRGMIALVAGAVLLLGGAIALVFFLSSDDSSTGGGLGRGLEVDTTRPDDPIRRGSAVSTNVDSPQNPFMPRRPVWRPPPVRPPDPVDGKGLDAKEIEDMAAKNSGITQRCWQRAQRGADGIILGDVRKIYVTVSVDGPGVVTDVQLSEHANTSLGKCLSGSIRGWKFRQTQRGITARFALVFQSG